MSNQKQQEMNECHNCGESVDFKDFNNEYNICNGCSYNIIYENINESVIQVEYNQKLYFLPRSNE